MNAFRSPSLPDHGTPQSVPVTSGARDAGRTHRRTAVLGIVGIVAILGVGLVSYLAGRNGRSLSTTAEPTANSALITTAPAGDSSDDGILSEAEYLTYVDLIENKGYSALDRDSARDLASSACTAARASETQYQFAAASAAALPPSLDPYEAGFNVGLLAVDVCRADMTRLGFVR